jgi:hypothetical protein
MQINDAPDRLTMLVWLVLALLGAVLTALAGYRFLV